MATRCAGVWIDQRKAVIVTLTAEVAVTQVVLSNVEKHSERGGDSPMHGSYEAHQVPADDRRQRALTGELDGYYDRVISALGIHNGLLILGPGEAKGQLRARLVNKKPTESDAIVEAADHMTEPQVVARVREHFGAALPRSRA